MSPTYLNTLPLMGLHAVGVVHDLLDDLGLVQRLNCHLFLI